MDESKQIATEIPFQIGQWEVDPSNNELRQGGLIVKLEPKVMDVLIYMVGRAGQVVSREDLEEKVWAGRIVTYDALTSTIVKLRKAFQTGDHREPVIKTIPKRGYCLVAPVGEKSTPDLANTTGTTSPETEDTKRNTADIVATPKLAKAASELERRQITVLACELTDQADGARQPDPEELHELYQRFYKLSADVARQYGGHIAQYTNGQLIIYFGYPVAHEGDAERAILTGLGILGATSKLAKENSAAHKHLSLITGIDTGLVVVGEAADDEQHEHLTVVGDTPTIARALKNAAQPGTLLVGETTKRLVEDRFTFEPGAITRISPAHSIQPFQVMESAQAAGRFTAKARHGLLPLVGRDIEIDLLMKRWGQAKTGESQVVCLCADAGIGKSRILQGLQERIQQEDYSQVLLACSPYHVNSALYPVAVYLEHLLDIQLNDDIHNSVKKIEALLTEHGLIARQTAPVLATLLSLPIHERYPDFEPSPVELKKRILESMAGLFRAMASRKPLLLIVEDAHWSDPTTRELMDLLIKEFYDQRVLFVTNYRPEFDPSWSGYMQTTLLRLNRLGKADTVAMIENISQNHSLPENIQTQIIERTDGVPLFIEELTKSVLSSAVIEKGHFETLTIPESLQDSLMARLDKLKSAKQLAQLASVLGRSFRLDILSAVCEINAVELDAALAELESEELIYARGMKPDVTYEFKHALVQDTAYQSLLKSTRQQLHQKTAAVLQNRFPQIGKTRPEVLAHHFTEARQYDQAITYWLRAGKRACEHSANIEAIAHLNKGLDLVSQLSDRHKSAEQELRLLLVLGPALLAARGLGARDAENVYLRARELCRETDDLSELFTVTWGLWLLCQKRGRLNEAQTFSDELLALANKLDNQEYLLQAYHAAWTVSFRVSDFQSCAAYTRQGLKLYDAKRHRSHANRFGSHDPGVCAFYNTAMTKWLLGYADEARAAVQNAVELAHQIDHPFSQVLAHVFAGFIAQCCGEPQHVATHTQSVKQLCTTLRIAPDCEAQAGVLAGWVETQIGDLESGINLMEQAFISHRATGVRTHEPYLLTILADSYVRAGQAEPGLRIVSEALNSIRVTGERTFEAEATRIKGELLLIESASQRDESINCLQQAIAIARQQQAKSLELRAVMSLCRSQPKPQRREFTTQVLQPLYAEFQQGHDTVDLRAASTMLMQLS